MTREQAKQLLPIITAWTEGETIQYKNESENLWVDLLDHSHFILPAKDYRIKREPREWALWAQKPSSGNQITGGTCTNLEHWESIRVREILD